MNNLEILARIAVRLGVEEEAKKDLEVYIGKKILEARRLRLARQHQNAAYLVGQGDPKAAGQDRPDAEGGEQNR